MQKIKPPLPIKILEKTILAQRFNTLCEYLLQMPSLSNEGSYGQAIRREVVHCNDASVVLLYAQKEDSFLMIQEYRTGVFFNANGNDDPLILQCVAGMIEPGKTPEETAQKEAQEEAGVSIEPGKLKKIGSVYPSPGRITEKVHIFFASLETAPPCGIFGLAEEGEQIRTHLVSRGTLYRMMDEQIIKDCMALLALNWFRTHESSIRCP